MNCMPPVPPVVLSDKVSEALTTVQGKIALARAMAQPLRTTRDYSRPCKSCGVSFIIEKGIVVSEGGASDGCDECIARSVMES